MKDKNMKLNLVKCPVCKTPMFSQDDFPGSYFICDICRWEDDSVRYNNHDFDGGANDVSLNQAIKNYKLYGISDPTKLVIKPNLP